MATEIRNSGLSIVGDVPWGTHFCHFYDTKQDLLDTLVPYFKAGLESKEFCIWVVSNSELITVEEARGALAQAVSDLDEHVAAGNIEILNGPDWYLEENVFNLERVTKAWDAKLERALARGFEGMRVSGDTFWLAEKDRRDFCDYEKQLNDSLANQPMTVLCTYALAKSGAAELLDVAQTHKFAIARRRGDWEVIETPQLTQAKAEIKKLNEALEQRVIERTNELSAANEELISEIAQRRSVEEQLRERATDLIEAQRVAKIGNWSFDLRDNKVTWSEELHRIFEVEKPDFDGRHESFVSRIHPDDQSRVLRTNAQTRIEGSPFDIEYRIITRNDKVKIIREVGYAAHDEAGQVIRLFGTAQDITDRKHAEALLYAKEQEFRAIVENAPDQIIRYDREFRRAYVNPAVARAYGLPREALIGKLIGSVIQEAGLDVKDDELTQLRQQIANVFDTGKSCEYELNWPLAAGRRYFSVRLFPELDLNGSVVNVLGISRDITERKEAEEKLNTTTEHLRALSASLQAAKEEEATRIAREIHDELGATLSSLRWDLEDLDDAISRSGERSQVEELRQKIAAMMKLTDTTVNTVRRIASELRPIALDALGLSEAIEWQARQFQERTGIIVQCECDLESVDLSGEHSTAVFRIFQEALTNILRHAQATNVHIQLKNENGEFILTISDNGRGITDDEKLGHRTLGLLGMRERAHLIGGKIEITGSEGKGTVVIVRIPTSS